MIMLLIAAIGALVAGVLAILYGIPVKEFSFGNTMVLAGVIGICTGLVIFGLWVTTREMRALTLRIAAPASAGLHDPSLPELSLAELSLPEPGTAPSQPVRSPPLRYPVVTTLPERQPQAVEPQPPVFPPFPQAEIEDRAPQPEPVPAPAAAEPEPPQKPRRNLLFESSVRKDRERGTVANNGPAAPVDPAQRTVFEDPIAQRGADRADRLNRARSPSTFAEPAPVAQPTVTVLKSGVVDGMSYSLYSDGSIDAEMPEGTMRFASIDELRAHLDQRGA